MDETSGYIINKASKRKIPLEKKSGVYVFKIWTQDNATNQPQVASVDKEEVMMIEVDAPVFPRRVTLRP